MPRKLSAYPSWTLQGGFGQGRSRRRGEGVQGSSPPPFLMEKYSKHFKKQKYIPTFLGSTTMQKLIFDFFLREPYHTFFIKNIICLPVCKLNNPPSNYISIDLILLLIPPTFAKLKDCLIVNARESFDSDVMRKSQIP